MKDFLEQERKIKKLIQQVQSPLTEASRIFQKTNFYSTFNAQNKFINTIQIANKAMLPVLKNYNSLSRLQKISSIANSVNKSSMEISKVVAATSFIKPYCLPNSLLGTSSALKTLSGNLAKLATGTNNLFAAQVVVDNFTKQWQKTQATIEKWMLINLIFDEYYPIFDEDLINKIRHLRKKDSLSLEKCIINYYKKNKYENLKKGYKLISDKKVMNNRTKIVDSCMKSMFILPRKERYNLIIPTLTAQITGLMEDCTKLIPIDFKKSHKGLSDRQILIEYASRNFTYMYFRGVENIVEKTFCRTDNFIKLSADEQNKYNKIRPGILHGSECCLDYGTEKNLILSWLELFLLVKIGEYFYNCNKEEVTTTHQS